MDTTNVALAFVIAVMSFFVGMEVKEYQIKSEARAIVSELVKGWNK